MAFASFDRKSSSAPMAEINMVPLIDVVLVLLVIFIVTAPLLTHSVKIDLPKASSSPNLTRPDHIEFGIRTDGSLYWNGEIVALEQLAPRFAAGARLVPPRGAAALRLDFGPAAFPRGPPFDDFGPDDFGPDDFGPDDFGPFGDFPPLRPPRAGLIARPPQLRNTQYLRHGQSRQGLRRDFPSP